MAKLEIDVLSDTICPWCYIGKRRLTQALELLDLPSEASVHWFPFELNPRMPEEGMDRRAYRTMKFGSWEKSQALDQGVTEAGATVGIDFAFDRIDRTPNTGLSHRLIALGRLKQCEDAIVERLFSAYFVEGKDIGSIDILRSIAVSNGIDEGYAQNYLTNNDQARTLEELASKLRTRGIQGVPFYIVNGEFTISGAQPVENFVAVLRQALDHTGTEDAPSVDNVCSIEDGTC